MTGLVSSYEEEDTQIPLSPPLEDTASEARHLGVGHRLPGGEKYMCVV